MIKKPLICKALTIDATAVELFSHFAHLPHAVFLDSASASHPDSHFDLISFAPQHSLTAQNGSVFLDEIEQKDNLFTLMQRLLSPYQTEKAPHDLPFSGGWLGYFSYDLGRYIERLPSKAKNDIALPDATIGLYPDALIYHKKLACWFYISQPSEQENARLDKYLAQINTPVTATKFNLTSPWQSNMDYASYEEKFNQVQAYLHSGDCYQINLAQRFCASYSGSPWHAYLQLREQNSAPFSAYIALPDHNAVLSLSPERFIGVNDGKVQSKPIKGTLPRLSDADKDKQQAEALANSPKDRAENVMIVDLLRNDLGKVAKAGSVNVPSLFAIESFPAVHHLVSTVTSTLAAGKTAIDQLEAAFPGGSITGAPKIRAMEIIEQLEPHRRSIYCGSIGYISACGNMDTSITIRTLVAKNSQLYCWAGGGIVADSKARLEYQETYDKVNKILPVLV